MDGIYHPQKVAVIRSQRLKRSVGLITGSSEATIKSPSIKYKTRVTKKNKNKNKEEEEKDKQNEMNATLSDNVLYSESDTD
jgi:hypothetical protein